VKRFDGVTAVDHISFVVPEGVIFGFLGPNGAGKTMTIKMLTTVLTPSEGQLSIAGHDPVREPLPVRRAFGILFQDPSLDGELTAAENMELHGVLYRVPRAEGRARVEALLRFVGLWERRHDYVKRFSGGMRRRLEIARALQHRPRILFLDEPTAGLDPPTRNQIWEFIRALSRDENVTVFFTTHYMGGGARRRPDCGHRPRPDRRRGHRRGAAATDRRPHPGGRVHRADRPQHPRGRGDADRPHADDAWGWLGRR
jgi:ABC-2 type transport system ATP-binding protein